MNKPTKPCQNVKYGKRCIENAVAGERYCQGCRRVIIRAVRAQAPLLPPRTVHSRAPLLAKGSRDAVSWYRGETRDNEDQ